MLDFRCVFVRCQFAVFSRSYFLFLMIRRPPRSTQSRSSAASDVYKRQGKGGAKRSNCVALSPPERKRELCPLCRQNGGLQAVSYTHLRAHETVLDLVCRLLLEKKKKNLKKETIRLCLNIFHNNNHSHTQYVP